MKTIAIDFDGVLTDGKHYIGEDGKLFYATHSRDNWAIAQLIAWGCQVDLVTSNDSPIVKKFAEDRKMGYVYSRDKKLETDYDIVVVDSNQDSFLAQNAKMLFCPKDGADGFCMAIMVPVNGGCGVIDYIVRKFKSKFI